MKKKNNIYRLIFIFVVIIVFFTVLYFSLNKNVSISFGGIRDLLYKPFLSIKNNQSDIVGKNINNELKIENEELKKLTGVGNSLSEFKKINATIIERNEAFWLDKLVLNKGKKDGVDIGDAVVVGEGLIGRITNITNNTSTLKLITSSDNTNKISVKIRYKETYIYKILQVEGSNLVIVGIDNEIDLNNDSDKIVLTSGLSDVYPSGITIGVINNVVSDKYGVSKKAYVSTSVDFDSLRFVSILSRG